jgi:hypothetical protein
MGKRGSYFWGVIALAGLLYICTYWYLGWFRQKGPTSSCLLRTRVLTTRACGECDEAEGCCISPARLQVKGAYGVHAKRQSDSAYSPILCILPCTLGTEYSYAVHAQYDIQFLLQPT